MPMPNLKADAQTVAEIDAYIKAYQAELPTEGTAAVNRYPSYKLHKRVLDAAATLENPLLVAYTTIQVMAAITKGNICSPLTFDGEAIYRTLNMALQRAAREVQLGNREREKEETKAFLESKVIKHIEDNSLEFVTGPAEVNFTATKNLGDWKKLIADYKDAIEMSKDDADDKEEALVQEAEKNALKRVEAARIGLSEAEAQLEAALDTLKAARKQLVEAEKDLAATTTDDSSGKKRKRQ